MVGMILESKFAKCFLDIFIGGVSAHAQDLVIIALFCHVTKIHFLTNTEIKIWLEGSMPLQHITILYLTLFAVYRLDLVEFAVNGAVIFFTPGRRLIPGRRRRRLLLLLVSFRANLLHSFIQFLRRSFERFNIATL